MDHFGLHTLKINAQAFESAWPQLSYDYGQDQELMVEIELAKPRIAFGYEDKDITFHVHSKIGIKLDGEMNWLIYDEIDFQFTMDVEVESEVVFASFGQLEFKKGGKDPERNLPVFNDL